MVKTALEVLQADETISLDGLRTFELNQLENIQFELIEDEGVMEPEDEGQI